MNVSFSGVPVLDDLTWRAERGEVTALLGPNGAGKTTTMLTCEGLVRPDSGRVRVLGLEPRADARALRGRIGVMIQDGGLPVMARAGELLAHIARLYAHPRDVTALARQLGIDAFARTSVRRLSGGQRQRLALALAVVGRPELVFLDEPSAGLDPQARQVVWDLVRALRDHGTAVVLSTHLMDEAELLADQVVILDHGRVIADGAPRELTAPPATDQGMMLHGPLSKADLQALRLFARERGLRLGAPTGGAPSDGRRTLEDVFLDLTGRGLR